MGIKEQENWDIVKDLTEKLSRGDKAVIRLTKKKDLVNYHMSLGLYIRNNYPSVRHDLRSDDRSMLIIEMLHKRLNDEHE